MLMIYLICLGIGFSTPLFANLTCPYVNLYTTQTINYPVVGLDEKGRSVIMASASDDSNTFYQMVIQLGTRNRTNLHTFLTDNAINESGNAISVNAQGNAAVIWLESDPNTTNRFVRSSILTNDNWNTPSAISDRNLFSAKNNIPGLYFDSSNKAHTLWGGENTSNSNALLQENLFSSTWQGTNDIALSYDLKSIVLAGNPSGKAMGVVALDKPYGKNYPFILQAVYYNGTSWKLTEISSNIVDGSNPPTTVAMNRDGNAIIAWSNYNQGLNAIIFSNGIFGKEKTILLLSIGEEILNVVSDIDDFGNVFVLCLTTDRLVLIPYSDDTWKTPLTFDSTAFGQSFSYPNLKLDSQGNGFAVWQKNSVDRNSIVYIKNYDSLSNTWGDNELLSNQNICTMMPHLDVNDFGDTIVVWKIINKDETNTLQAIYIKDRIPLPPDDLIGKQKVNQFLLQSDLINVLSWSPSTDTTVISYNIYRNDVYMETILSADTLKYEDHNRQKGKSDTYQVTAVNQYDIESVPLTLTLP